MTESQLFYCVLLCVSVTADVCLKGFTGRWLYGELTNETAHVYQMPKRYSCVLFGSIIFIVISVNKLSKSIEKNKQNNGYVMNIYTRFANQFDSSRRTYQIILWTIYSNNPNKDMFMRYLEISNLQNKPWYFEVCIVFFFIIAFLYRPPE